MIYIKSNPKIRGGISEEWEEFLKWKAQIAGDELLYASVNESLDKIIDDVIGRDQFEKRLKIFERLR